jgi:hypothetical protein
MRRLLQRLMSSTPSAGEVAAEFPQPRFTRLRLDAFPRGVDKIHIDVALGQALPRATALFAEALTHEVAQQIWKHPVSNSSEVLAESFRELLREQARAVVKKAPGEAAIERVQLFQLAVWKQSLGCVDEALAGLREELEAARSRETNSRALHYHQQLASLARHADHVRYRVALQLLGHLMRVEHGGLRNLRQSVLGLAWPVAEEMLENPILLLDGIGGLRDFIRHYPPLLHDLDASRNVAACLYEAFDDGVPATAALPKKRSAGERAESIQERRQHRQSRGLLDTERWALCLLSRQELETGLTSWLDQPDNAVTLLGGEGTDWPQVGLAGSRIEPLQRELNRRFHACLKRAGLWERVEASYVLAEIYPSLGLKDAEPLILGFLAGEFGRRELVRRLASLGGNSDPATLARRIEAARKDYLASPRAGRPQLTARLAGDFLRLRRDLKLAVKVFSAMDGIRLLQDEADLVVSRHSGGLQLFYNDGLEGEQGRGVVGHVILKVEIRGSTALTHELRRRNLNPAAYFSRYFFDPVERVRQRFGAHKVSVDGDAMLLTITEHDAEGMEQLAVARASCLAVELLRLVESMNAESERLGLRRLELGLGIAYADEAPTYLYDQSRRVVVSSAIRPARRMASCHLLLRKSCSLPGGQGVCVATPVSGQLDDEQEEDLVRFNINGIELAAAAFARLNVELSLYKLRLREGKERRPGRLYLGRCPDLDGNLHWLLIREQRVRLWMGRQLLEAEDEGRSYYEVVTDQRLLDRVRQMLEDRLAKSPQTANAARQ